jgi:Peptidase family M28
LKTAHLLLFCCAACIPGTPPAAAAQPQSRSPVLPFNTRTILNAITPGELKGDLSFLASDALAGRFTPSPGLEVAAEFIASRFRSAGLEPGGDQDYFQLAKMVDRRPPRMTGRLHIVAGSQTMDIPAEDIQIYQASQASAISQAPVVYFPTSDVEALKKTDLAGKVVIHKQPDMQKLREEKALDALHNERAFTRALRASAAALEIAVADSKLSQPAGKLLTPAAAGKRQLPVLIVVNSDLVQLLAQAPKSVASVEIPAPEDRPVVVKNVVGVLRGVDPQLKNTYVLLTAHYDHIGTVDTGKGMAPPTHAGTEDRIYNGANDDGSGTVSVIEIARALARFNPRPKRSIVFMTFFGEELGLVGSQYYTEHPRFPLANTVADVNLEQVGRTDANNGSQINTASLTGYDYSDVTSHLERAGALTGIKVYKDAEASDTYFAQSDNFPLAEAGIPAHSLTVAFEYPDYHGLGDEWQKIDYNNMARVDRMIALAVLNMANALKPPAWNLQNPKTKRFRAARSKFGHGT